MNLKEMLKVADDIVFAKTGKHLDDLEEAVLRGTLEHDTYKQIAKDFDCSVSNVRNAGSKLWKILAKELGEDVNKSNFKSAMERLQNANLFNFAQDVVVSGSFNICGESRHPPDTPNPHQQNENISQSESIETLHNDLSEMPDLGAFYNRIPELSTLTNWILQQRCRLIAITGISGIGKTALTVQLVQQIKDEFEYVIWCDFDSLPILAEFQSNLIRIISQSEQLDLSANNQKFLPLIKYLQKYRCLVVLDNIQNLFSSGELAGKYKPEYQDYRTLFKQIKELSHQSCVVLIGWEQPRIITEVKSENSLIRTLRLTGLDIVAAREIFRDNGLTEIDNWDAIIQRYQGNPFWLNSIANLMQDLGECEIKVLINDTLLLPEDVKDSLQQQCDRLSEIEKQVLSLLAKENDPVNLVKLLENSKINSSDLINALQSLLKPTFRR
ncbi:NB-ARC domain-containing protein [Planktothrix agardhii]|uniref:NB-ARC domain-containing protein n=1 Tax=Planktothrix agardhii TaxID=1160 RepID=UPI001F47D88E|nr:NB-ARC domain-containing protein [Planktothrix agardhii]MCF3570667.1 NB-ARC domain-containing protein [Planktothrix agardhii 1805]MCF3586287.1 NB-ARC domain-containing protein [Planktothrix agardhii 1803]MCP9293746.1 NB-ARC domain-containing protein [Planktothrix agardhii LY1]CAD5913753.1 putative WD repeat-containing protein alr2800 [Planktothrix agardhii]